MTALKQFLDDQFKIKNLGLVHYFLGLEVFSHSDGYVLHQHKYTSDFLEEFKCSHLSPISTPLDPSVKLTGDMGDLLPYPSLYRRLVGKMNFLQHTRPDIAYFVQHLSQFLQTPKVPHIHYDYSLAWSSSSFYLGQARSVFTLQLEGGVNGSPTSGPTTADAQQPN
uniref:Uncharacterized mitochondrial protein AtMg00810-like n=1 Tax=Nicotiana tabacum TaxID=4097 RepID=A0A1S4BUW2_TOBAC|nr:PREDICTED: uncharacterized mitochondrial protein AtMg00810-like [Nicotiana tabacum]